MPIIKSATTVTNEAIKRKNFLLGVDTTLPYGPTDNGVVIPAVDVTNTRTFFWSGITPPYSGYTLYVQKETGGPSIFVLSSDTLLRTAALQNGAANINSVTDALSFFDSQTNFLVTNIEYPSISTSGLTVLVDAGFIPSYPRSGTTWNDLSGKNNNATLLLGPTYNGANLGSIVFDGTNDYATFPTGFISTLTACTVSFWFSISANPTWARVFDFGTSTTNFMFFTPGYSAAPSTPRFAINNGPGEQQLTSPTVLALNTWYNYTITMNGSTGNMYRNGALEVTNTSMTYTPSSLGSTNQNYLGDSQFPADPTLNGRIGVFQIYNRAFSATEVLNNYNLFLPRYSLVLYWDISNPNSYPGTGTTVFDISGNGNNGTITGGVTYSTNNGGILTTNGTTGYISSTTPNLASTNYTVIGGARYNGATRGRVINSRTNNWLLGHWSNSVANYYAEGWVSPAAATGGSDTTWRVYAGTGNIAGDSYAFYINSTLTNGPNNGGSAGPNGFAIGVAGLNTLNTEWSTADFSFLLVYNAVLSATEITKITNLYRGRFGI